MARVPVLLAAGGASWEAAALRALTVDGFAVVKRCVDLPDLLATAATGMAEIAVVSGDLVGLDVDAMGQLLRAEVGTVAIGGPGERLRQIGVTAVIAPEDLGALGPTVRSAGLPAVVDVAELEESPPPAPRGATGRVVAVHGAAGAPGRTTVAIGLAAERARLAGRCVLIDADPHGGAVAQHLGVLDEVSGLLAAARLVNAGALDDAALLRCRRQVVDGLELLTGLPRPDRWVEVRSGVLDEVLTCSVTTGDVVVDTGFSLEDDADLDRGVSRNQLTLDAVAAADEVVVVGSAEPTGLARLARTLVDLRDATDAPVRVVVNRMRDSLGWSRKDITAMVEGYSRPLGVHYLPEDRPTTDRALVTGRSVVELGDSALRRALGELHEAVFAGAPTSLVGSAHAAPISR